MRVRRSRRWQGDALDSLVGVNICQPTILCRRMTHAALWSCNRCDNITLIIEDCRATFYVVETRLSVFRKAMRSESALSPFN